MLFNSLQFIIFFPIVIALYFLIPYKKRWILLLAASYYFYMCWKVDYIILIMASTIIDYICSNKMSKLNNQKRKKPWLIASVISNLSILFGFKYFNFFSENIQLIFNNYNIFYEMPFLMFYFQLEFLFIRFKL